MLNKLGKDRMQRSYNAGSALMQRVETIQFLNNPECGNLEKLGNVFICHICKFLSAKTPVNNKGS